MGDKKIIEIGAGLSTITFLNMGFKQVTSIAPDFILSKKIEEACSINDIDIQPLRFEIGLSEILLPKIAEETKNGDMYDVVFIDGDHGWPSVFVDFCYTNYSLKKGGLLILDDCHTYAVNELVNFLKEDDAFRLHTKTDSNKIVVFEKMTDQKLTSGGMRPYLKRKFNEMAPPE